MSTTVTTVSAPRRAHIGRYGLWQLRDYFMDRGSLTLILCTALGYAQVYQVLQMTQFRANSLTPQAIARYGSAEAARQAIMHNAIEGFVRSFLGTVVFLGALLAINGIAANDRKMGFYRFLFAKPLSPVRYYGQAFAINWLGFVGVFTLLTLLFGAMVSPIITLPLVTAATLVFFCYAGIGFLFSAATRSDWLALIAVSVAAQILWNVYGTSASVFAKLLYLLPPLTKTSEVFTAAAAGTALPWGTLGWFAGYGAVCLCAGLAVLHYRRLAIN